MANVLKDEKKQQIITLGRLGWSLRKIQEATRVRRETISTYLKAAGVGVWPPGGWGRQTGSKPAMGVTTDFGAELSTPRPEIQGLIPGESAKPAIEVTTGFGAQLRGPRSEHPSRNPSASACEPGFGHFCWEVPTHRSLLFSSNSFQLTLLNLFAISARLFFFCSISTSMSASRSSELLPKLAIFASSEATSSFNSIFSSKMFDHDV